MYRNKYLAMVAWAVGNLPEIPTVAGEPTSPAPATRSSGHLPVAASACGRPVMPAQQPAE